MGRGAEESYARTTIARPRATSHLPGRAPASAPWMKLDPLGRLVRGSLSDELLSKPYLAAGNRLAHCYVASEAYFHLAGGKDAGLKAVGLQHEGSQHWWIEDASGKVIDLTADQFSTPVPYAQGKGRGFLTRQPSARARTVIDRVLAGPVPAAQARQLNGYRLRALYDQIHSVCAAGDADHVPRQLVDKALDADVMVIGQALGRDTQRLSGLPWMFPDGKLSGGGRTLDNFLAGCGQTVQPEDENRSYVYCTDMAHHFPGRREEGKWDKEPTAEELERSRGWLESELSTVQPKVVVLLGKTAALQFLERYAGVQATKLSDVLGKRHRCHFEGREFDAYPVHHPSAAWQFPQSKDIYRKTAQAIRRRLSR